MSLESQVEQGLSALGALVDEAQRSRMLAHLQLVAKWNRVHNLTAVRETEQMVALHLLDSLSVLPYLAAGRRLIDIGTGAGFPGIPIAIARPDVEVTLLDSAHKKCSFLEQARTELELANVTVACERVEQYRPADLFDVVISRAFAELSDFVSQSRHLVAAGGRLLAMKGIHPYDELARIPQTHRVAEVIELRVPTLEAKRHLVIVAPATAEAGSQ